jgi:hypothetical protein
VAKNVTAVLFLRYFGTAPPPPPSIHSIIHSFNLLPICESVLRNTWLSIAGAIFFPACCDSLRGKRSRRVGDGAESDGRLRRRRRSSSFKLQGPK